MLIRRLRSTQAILAPAAVVGVGLGLVILACAGNGNESRVSKSNESTLEKASSARGEPPPPEASKPAPTGDTAASPEPLSSTTLVSGEDEIIPIPEMPRIVVKKGEDLPEDPAALRDKAREELEKGNIDDALSMIDVLLVLNPEDAELVEIRSDILLKKGLTEDAAVDRARCCKLGRPSCCP
jgi:hypothetical protein